jgi:hypothetical protein
MKKVRLLVPLIAVLVLSAGCSSAPSGDNGFLVTNVDDSNKSIALTNQGIAAYNGYLVQKADYGKAEYVRQFFTVALRYDPDNPRAKQYLDKIDNFKSGLVRSKLKTANLLLAKPKRKESEDFALIVALQTATAIDPSNDQAGKLLKDNASIRDGLVDTYLQRSKDAKAKAADPATSDASREALYVSAYDNAAKAVAVAPSNSQAQSQKASLQGELGKAFDKHAAAAAKLVDKGKYDDAKVEVGRMGSLNSKLDGGRAPDLKAATYALYFKWAKALDAKGLLLDADDKLDVAIAARRSDEAIAFKAKLAARATSSNQEAAFDAALPEIDKYIAKGDFLSADKRIDAAAKLTKDKSKLDQLESRRAKMEDALGGIYDKGVTAYRSEDFKTAIDQLSIVVGIDAEYEQASDYLSKAKEKQKLLDQYSD